MRKNRFYSSKYKFLKTEILLYVSTFAALFSAVALACHNRIIEVLEGSGLNSPQSSLFFREIHKMIEHHFTHQDTVCLLESHTNTKFENIFHV